MLKRNSKGQFVKGMTGMLGESNPAWRGKDASLDALHMWVKQRLGRPKKCEHCLTTTAKRYEWANKSHEYKRDLNDWLRLCVPCHMKYDGHIKTRSANMVINGIPFFKLRKKYCLRGHLMETSCRPQKNGSRKCFDCTRISWQKYDKKRKEMRRLKRLAKS